MRVTTGAAPGRFLHQAGVIGCRARRLAERRRQR